MLFINSRLWDICCWSEHTCHFINRDPNTSRSSARSSSNDSFPIRTPVSCFSIFECSLVKLEYLANLRDVNPNTLCSPDRKLVYALNKNKNPSVEPETARTSNAIYICGYGRALWGCVRWLILPVVRWENVLCVCVTKPPALFGFSWNAVWKDEPREEVIHFLWGNFSPPLTQISGHFKMNLRGGGGILRLPQVDPLEISSSSLRPV